MKKVMIIFGTRPEAIKLSPLIIKLRKHARELETVVCVSAQHREILDKVLKLFEIIPDYDLNLMKDDQNLFEITGSILSEVGKVIDKHRPDIVLVQGDTTTTFAASLAAYYNRVKVGHIEAGLRTNNKYFPFPEEINRKLTGHIADIHFAPTERNKAQLLLEGIKAESVEVTGNTVIDSLFWVTDKLRHENSAFDGLKRIEFEKKVILVTGHRRENFGQRLINVCKALKQIAERNDDAELVYPVHPNPNVRKVVQAELCGIRNVKLMEPLDYGPFVYLMEKCYFIISDSGGIQEEAPSLGKPVLVTRDRTERPEAVDVGAVKLVGTDTKMIVEESERLLNDIAYYDRFTGKRNPYGDGRACERIINRLRKDLDII